MNKPAFHGMRSLHLNLLVGGYRKLGDAVGWKMRC